MAYKVTALPTVTFTSSASQVTNPWVNLDDASSITIYLSTQFSSANNSTYFVQGSPLESTANTFFSTAQQPASTASNNWFTLQNIASTATYSISPGQAATVTGISMLQLRLVFSSVNGGASTGDSTGAGIFATKQISV